MLSQPQYVPTKKSLDQAITRLVVSDFHLGVGKFFSDGSENVLEDFNCDEEFADFLTHYSQGPYANLPVELVLNGDILNLLQIDDLGVHGHLITERATIRAIERIVSGHPIFFKAMRAFGLDPSRSIVYVIGNHDAGLIWPGARRAFERAVGCRVRFFEEFYCFDQVHIEHGQQHEEVCRLDMESPVVTRGLPEPVLNLPWGSIFVAIWLTRIKLDRPHFDKVKPISALIRWLLIHDTLWALMTILKMGKFIWNTVLFRSHDHVLGRLRVTWSMLKQVTVYPSFDDRAAKVFDENPHLRVVIFGHTHVLRYRKFQGDREYFNEGSWNEVTNLELGEFGTKAKLTYVLIESAGPGARPKVRLKRWMGSWKPEMDLLG